MTQAILLLDYEPRTSVRVSEALSVLGCQIVTAKDVDAAVAACAKVEPQVVLTTSVLPRLKVEDAITQLRARAGLRHTPFLVLMSGYTGHEPRADAARLGAQDIVSKPFSNEELLEHVRALMSRPRSESGSGAESRAEVLEALRRASGSANAGTVTSKDLFGDLLVEEQAPRPTGAQQAQSQPPAGGGLPTTPPPPAPRVPSASRDAGAVVDDALASTLADLEKTTSTTPKARKASAEVSVDKLLEDTLSGLDLHKPKPAARAAAEPAELPASVPPDAPSTATPAGPFAKSTELPVMPQEPFEQPPEPPPPAPLATDLVPPEVEDVPTPLPSGTPFGQYELMEPIATGGMAEVYRARMRGVEGFQKIVAIKRILPHLTDNDEFLSMFVDEAKLAAQLQHPNIVHIYDLGKVERSYYIAMEFIDGRDLRSILQKLEERKARLPLGLALFIASRLAAALDYAHRKRDLQGKAMGLVHRDISPQNVLISYDGDIKLCDFGIAKAASKASHTRAGALKGKLQYMSPEQAWGKDIDNRSDIYSLGLVLHEMLTGRKPFAGDSELSILEQVRAPHLIPPRELDPAIPPEVERVVMKALREDRDDRYQTAGELAADLGNMLQVIRPTPGAGELGAFLAEIFDRERPTAGRLAPSARPAVTPPPQPSPARPVEEHARARHGAQPPAPAHPPVEVPEVFTAPKPSRVGLFVGVGVVVVAVAAGGFYLTRVKHPSHGALPEEAPPPGTVAMAHQAAQQEVARQTDALGDLQTTENQAPPVAPAPRRPAGPSPARAAAVVPTAPERPAPAPTGPAAAPTTQARPTAVVAAATQPAAAPAVAPAVPTELPTETATAAPATTEPTAQPPTPVPPTATIAPTHAPLVAPPPAVHEGDLVEMGTGVIPPEPIYNPKPAYPPWAERQRASGVVVLDVLVDENGAVQDIKVLRGIKPDYGLNAAAVDAVRGWHYKPATKDGVRVKMRISVTVAFKLQA
jgi:TonB family protein